MSANFQTISTMDPSESAFVLTLDDNLVLPSNIPAVGTRWRDWDLGQKHRTIDSEWNDYVYVDSREAGPGQRGFVFGKAKSAAELLVPFESYWDNEFYSWPEVMTQTLPYKTTFVSSGGSYISSTIGTYLDYFVKSPAEVESLIKIERFQNTTPWPEAALRHRKPITSDVKFWDGTVVRNCLHGKIRIPAYLPGTSITQLNVDPETGSLMAREYPATNFTDWAPFVLRDGQKQINGMWVREKITIYPPNASNTKIRKVFSF